MNVNELVVGTQSQMLTETIDNDSLYDITDQRPILRLTNAEMGDTYIDKGLIRLNDVVFCLDTDTYLAGHLYQYNGYGWVHLGYLQYKEIPKVVSGISSTSTNTEAVGALAVYNALQAKENTSNKSTTLNSSSTTTQYPTSKTVYDFVSGNYALKSGIEIRSAG